MKFDKKYTGKWVAVKNDKVVASDLTLTKLSKKLGTKNSQEYRITLIPKGLISG